MKKLLASLLFAAPALVAPVVSYGASELVRDGSFEAFNITSASGWDIFRLAETGAGWYTGTRGIEVRRNIEGIAASGSQFAELDTDGNSEVFQSLQTVANQTYHLSFLYSNRIQTWAATNGLSFTVDGGAHWIDLATPATNYIASHDWREAGYDFTASGTTLLGFRAIGASDSYGTSLDAVSVTGAVNAVPEPSTLSLLLAGLGASTWLARRRRQR